MVELPVCLVAAISGLARSETKCPMIDILVYLFENYHDFSSHPKPDALARKLSVVGFEEEEISMALGWLAGLKDAHSVEFSSHCQSLRVFTTKEQQKLGGDCLSLILFLESAEVLTPVLRELVIDRAMLLDDDPLSLEKFKIIVLMVLWSREQALDPLIVEELLYDAEPEVFH